MRKCSHKSKRGDLSHVGEATQPKRDEGRQGSAVVRRIGETRSAIASTVLLAISTIGFYDTIHSYCVGIRSLPTHALNDGAEQLFGF
jgi:hypothetical protein